MALEPKQQKFLDSVIEPLMKQKAVPFSYVIKETRRQSSVIVTMKPEPKFAKVLYKIGLFRDRVRPSRNDRKAVADKTGGKCFYCLRTLVGVWHVDHFIPMSLGGTDGLSNWVPSCRRCNLIKHARLPGNEEQERGENVNVQLSLG